MKTNAELLADATEQLNNVREDLNKKAEAALKEAETGRQLSAQTKDEVDRLLSVQNTLQESVNTLKASLGELEQEYARTPLSNARRVAETAGALVAKHEAVTALSGNAVANKRVSVPVQAALISGDVPGDVVAPDRLPGIDAMPKQRLFIRDLIAGGRTTSSTIYWVQQTGFTNNAAPVAENTTKPYSEIVFEEKITPVRTIAHLFKASKQILDDMAQLQSTVDAELRYGLKFIEEQQILFGDGTGQNLEGIVPQATAYNPAFAVENQSPIDDLRLAMLQVQLARYPASGHVLHFTDWARIELTKDTQGRYILANPAGLAGPTLWGLPVVATEAAGFLGKFLTGAFNTAAQLFDREETNVVISTENADDFEKNMISIRCEERLALAVKRPEAFVFGDLTPATPVE